MERKGVGGRLEPGVVQRCLGSGGVGGEVTSTNEFRVWDVSCFL